MECLLCLKSNQEITESQCIKVDSLQWEELCIKKLIDKHLWPIVSIYIILQILCILKDIIISKMLSLSRILLHHNHASVQYVGMN